MKLQAQRPALQLQAGEMGPNLRALMQMMPQANSDTTLFTQNGRLVLAETVEVLVAGNTVEERLRYETLLTPDHVMTWLALHMIFEKFVPQRGGGGSWEPTECPMSLVKAFLTCGHWPTLPELRDVVDINVMRPDGSIITETGFDEATSLYAMVHSDIKVMDKPTKAHVERAKELLLVDVLGDFEFATLADKANAVAAIITANTRFMYDCPLPLYCFDSTNPGSGKGTMASAIGEIWGGSQLQTMNSSEDELRKAILPALASPHAFQIFDNVEHEVGGPALAALLTSTIYSDRVLGSSTTMTLPNNKLWCVTGNNIKLGRDIPRRAVWVKQSPLHDPKDRDPNSYRHPQLVQWCRENRQALLWACLTLARSWVVNGAEKTDHKCDNATPWAQTVGGILEHVGIEGFLADRQIRQAEDEDSDSLAEFIESVRRLYAHGVPFKPKDIAYVLETFRDSGYGAMGGGHGTAEREVVEALPKQVRIIYDRKGGLAKSLGKYLASVEGRFAGSDGWRIVRTSPEGARHKEYAVQLESALTTESLLNF